MATASATAREIAQGTPSWRVALSGRWHERAMYVFLAVTIAHWMEHLFQAFQIYYLGMPLPQARGALGYVWPWLVSSEWLHYGYAVFMVVGLALLASGLAGRAKTWWTIALAIQVWHLFEHSLLLVQAQSGIFLFGANAPTSILQVVVRRPELHLFYNAIVTIPMTIGMLYHLFPNRSERAQATCTCAVGRAAAE